jgi:hypothetical protein
VLHERQVHTPTVGILVPASGPAAIPAALDKLEVGEGLEVKKTEYSHENEFYSYAHDALKGASRKPFTVRSLTDGSGWIVIRLE